MSSSGGQYVTERAYRSCWKSYDIPPFNLFKKVLIDRLEQSVKGAEYDNLKLDISSDVLNRIVVSGTFDLHQTRMELWGEIVWIPKHSQFRGKLRAQELFEEPVFCKKSVKGIRFYRSSVSSEQGKNAILFYYGEIEDQRSDFDYIFSPIYKEFTGKFIISDQIYLPDEEDDGLLYKQFEKLVIQDNQCYIVACSSILYLYGSEMPEFDGNNLLVVHEPPRQMSWKRYCSYGKDWPDNVDCFLHNWDGIYWEIFARSPRYFEILVAAHKGDNQLDMRWVDFQLDYPNPERERQELSFV